MLPQTLQRERTTGAREEEVRRWLLDELRRHGPGRYLLQVCPDGKVTLKYLTPAVLVTCPERLRLNSNGRA